jgi:hypothetical protein
MEFGKLLWIVLKLISWNGLFVSAFLSGSAFNALLCWFPCVVDDCDKVCLLVFTVPPWLFCFDENWKGVRNTTRAGLKHKETNKAMH